MEPCYHLSAYAPLGARPGLQTIRRRDGGRPRLLRGRPRAGSGLPRPERGREVHHHARHHSILRAGLRHDHARRGAARRGGARREAPHRLPPREQSAVRRHAGVRLSRLRRRPARSGGPRAPPGARCGRRGDGRRNRVLPADRRAVQGVPPASGPRAGDPSPPRSAGARRAHRRPRPEPARRDPPLDRRARQGSYGDSLDPHPLRGTGHLLAAADHQRRQAGGGRGRGPADPSGGGRGGDRRRGRGRGRGRSARPAAGRALGDPGPHPGPTRRRRAGRGDAISCLGCCCSSSPR